MTRRQKIVLDFIQAFIKEYGFSPSYVEIAQGIGLRSKSNICRIIHTLRDEGFIQNRPHTVRSTRVLNSISHIVKL